jgi:hypothetical protein
MPEFEDLPFSERPDLTPYLIHLTKSRDGRGAFENLINILQTGTLFGSGGSGYIKGPHTAACFMDVPFYSLKYVLTKANNDPDAPKYEPYGIFYSKRSAYQHGARPVIYLSNQELADLNIPTEELWRVVRFEVTDDGWISWLHEREWRIKGDFHLPSNPYGVLVRTSNDAQELRDRIQNAPDEFRIKPRSIIPLTVVCQGLIYL